MIIQRGTLRVGDSIVVGGNFGRVRRMVDEWGNDVEEAGPSRPVQVQGLNGVPGPGDNLLVVEDDRVARQIAAQRDARQRAAMQARRKKRVSLENLDQALKETSTLNLILKGDVSGSVEALEDALLKIDVGEEVDLRIIDRGVGAMMSAARETGRTEQVVVGIVVFAVVGLLADTLLRRSTARWVRWARA